MASFFTELQRRTGRADIQLKDAVALSTRFRRQLTEENGGVAPPQGVILDAIVAHLASGAAPHHQQQQQRVSCGKFGAVVSTVRQLFPDASAEHVRKLCEEKSARYGDDRLVDLVATAMLNHGYEKSTPPTTAGGGGSAGTAAGATTAPPVDFDGQKPFVSTDPAVQAWHQTYLANVFPTIPILRIKETYREAKSFSTTWRLLLAADQDPAVPKLAKPRLTLPVETSSQFDVCVAEVKHMKQALERESVRAAAIDAARTAGDLVECCVCYDDVPEPSAACCSADASHTICEGCLRRFVATELFENGKAKKTCVMDKCEGTYAEHAVMDVLDAKGRRAFASCQTRAALGRCEGLPEPLHTCPLCGDAVIVPPGNTVHTCPCGKHTCVLCEEDDHRPMRCDEYEAKHGRARERRIEEAMTEALIRRCVCGLVFVKDGGCNKMTCRGCGKYMCYLCKAMITGYDHFNTACSLSSNYEELDAARIKKAAADAAAAVDAGLPDVAAALPTAAPSADALAAARYFEDYDGPDDSGSDNDYW